MIELVDRKAVLHKNQVFGKFIVDLQNVIYNPLNGNKFDDLEDWEKESAEEFEKCKDEIAFTEKQKDYVGELLLSLVETNSIEKYPQILAVKIKSLVEKLGWEKVYFLMDYSIPWLSQKNDFPPVQKALTYLKQISIDKDFAGGIVVNVNEVENLIISVFWLGRCNASLPAIYFTGANSNVILHICKHGNLHLECYDKDEMCAIQEIATQLGFKRINNCDEFLEETDAIIGREIIV